MDNFSLLTPSSSCSTTPIAALIVNGGGNGVSNCSASSASDTIDQCSSSMSLSSNNDFKTSPINHNNNHRNDIEKNENGFQSTKQHHNQISNHHDSINHSEPHTNYFRTFNGKINAYASYQTGLKRISMPRMPDSGTIATNQNNERNNDSNNNLETILKPLNGCNDINLNNLNGQNQIDVSKIKEKILEDDHQVCLSSKAPIQTINGNSLLTSMAAKIIEPENGTERAKITIE
ncbi:hypothetical protein QR98_0014470 [Sarcoptes scabiei]|uniref:Uncharacterized protein n=1 Tax=Sarcoptes scabiei TaxID=52283 RepID=A0A131ZVX8_SARSC|nr:hypothetical protein QR98_0014470 [Sarcoptes scabiei]